MITQKSLVERGMFMAVIRNGKHDGHVHVFKLDEDGLPPETLPVNETEVLRLQRVTDAMGRPVYVHGKVES